ncbi:MAG: NAD(P)-dependent oxidoreductase [Opitutaceae bacterium]|nr:NAD(P)-dependent oxidoreductase [Opitutaceae bacterium]
MKAVVTGSSGHLGEALIRTLRAQGRDVVGLDLAPGAFTSVTGSITDRALVRRCLAGGSIVFHTAALHKPHGCTHARQDFIDTNITGTLVLLEEARRADAAAFIFTSTTSTFGDALQPPPGAPAAWITEDVAPVPKNIYGATKLAAEALCQEFQRNEHLPCLVLRTSRFFPEADDSKAARAAFSDDNLKVNEFLNRRVELEDVVSAHLSAAVAAPTIRFGRYIISATTPFTPADCAALRTDAAAVVRQHVPDFEVEYAQRGWKMSPSIDRVYINERARRDLGWQPRHDFRSMIARLRAGAAPRSDLARQIGSKGYHAEKFVDGPYPVA